MVRMSIILGGEEALCQALQGPHVLPSCLLHQNQVRALPSLLVSELIGGVSPFLYFLGLCPLWELTFLDYDVI